MYNKRNKIYVLKILDLFNIRSLHAAVSELPVNGMGYLLPLRLTVRNVFSRRITLNIVFLGIDLAKNVFQLCGLNQADKSGKINHTSGICSVCVVLYHRLYPTLYHNDSPEIYSLSVVSKLLLYGQCFDFVT
ncbi:hypothetical protein PU32_17845 [Escherichia coli]|nr:hypothetical protein [Escherichia coli]EEY5282851.1 hypothetical protein [Escherichia coli]EFO0750542.1 hypothetical protein [Escherichia coli]EFO2963296.1 hypothetical protein [Escherichia coli]KHI35483.1 hypothetical protein PU32_17845 [Escherichia coli]